jgi:hypothetical protein
MTLSIGRLFLRFDLSWKRLPAKADRIRTDRGNSLSDDVVSKITSRIRQADEEAALRDKLQLHRAELIAARAPIFFQDVVTRLQQNLNRLVARLDFGSTGIQTTLNQSSATSIAITRARHPFVNATVELKIAGQMILASWRKANPDPTAGVQTSSITFTLKVDADDNVIVCTSEETFFTGIELAGHLTELFFSA